MKLGCIQIPERLEKYIAVFHSNGEDGLWLSLKEFREETEGGGSDAQSDEGHEFLKDCRDEKRCAVGRSCQNLS